MDEIASLAVAAVALLTEGVATLGLVRSIVLHINSQFLRAMSELALLSV